MMISSHSVTAAGLTWFKSRHSSEQGGDCLEVAYTWRKSSYSGDEGGDCLEFAACPHTVHVRDSKNPGGPVLTVAPATWRTFAHSVGGKATG